MQSKDLTIWLLQALWAVVLFGVGFVVKRLQFEVDRGSERTNKVEILLATLKANDTAAAERIAGLKDDIKELRTEFILRVDRLDEKLDKIAERQSNN